MTDTISDASDGNSSTLFVPATPTSGDTNNDNVLQSDETWIYDFDYTIASDLLDTGDVKNSVSVVANTPDSTLLDAQVASVLLSAYDAGLGAGNERLDTSGDIHVTKALTTDIRDGVSAGDEVEYLITVENRGSTAIANVLITDNLVDGNGDAITSGTVGPDLIASSDTDGDNELDSNETWQYTFRYTVTQEALDSGGFNNTVDVSGDVQPGGGSIGPVTGPADPPEPTDPPLPEVEINRDEGEFTVTKEITSVSGSGAYQAGDVISYRLRLIIRVSTSLSNVSLTDTISDASDGNSSTLFVPATPTSGDTNNDNVLQSDETWIYDFDYTIASDLLDTGDVKNSVSVVANTPDSTLLDAQVASVLLSAYDAGLGAGNERLDTSGDIHVTKALTTDIRDGVSAGDEVEYLITVENRGSTAIANVLITDNLIDGNGDAITSGTVGPDLIASSDTDGDNELDSNETWQYTFRYTVTQEALDSGGFNNTVDVSGDVQPGGGSIGPVTGPADPPEPTDPPLPEVEINRDEGSFTVTKEITSVSGSGAYQAGDVISYRVTIDNTGSTSLSNVSLTDTISDASDGNSSTLFVPATPTSGDTNNDNVLQSDETWIYDFDYTIASDLLDTGDVKNSVSVVANTPDSTLLDAQVASVLLSAYDAGSWCR